MKTKKKAVRSIPEPAGVVGKICASVITPRFRGATEDPFGKLRGLLARLNAWSGRASACPDSCFCRELSFAVIHAARLFRVRRMPSLPEAVSWLHRHHRKLGVRRSLDDAEKKLRALKSRKPLIHILMDRSRGGDTDATEFLAALRRLDEGPKLSRFRHILAPEASDKSRPNLLAAAWRARWEHTSWLMSLDTSDLERFLDRANSAQKIEDGDRKRELARERQARKRADQRRSIDKTRKLT